MLEQALSWSRLSAAALSLALVAPLSTAGCGEACADCGLGGLGGEGGGTTTSQGGGGSGGSGGAGSCTSGQGTIEGMVYINAAPGSPDSAPGNNATIVLQSDPTATPLYGEADETGHFSIPLDAGQWLVGGEHSSNCQTPEPVTVQLDPCETEQFDLVLDACFDG